jgi:hypothetical protein
MWQHPPVSVPWDVHLLPPLKVILVTKPDVVVQDRVRDATVVAETTPKNQTDKKFKSDHKLRNLCPDLLRRALSGVRHHVHLEILLCLQLFTADLALEARILMVLKMNLQGKVVRADLAADATPESMGYNDFSYILAGIT